ncbi:MAG: hypothetical protein QNJ36_05720 [Calothrix sp. MO_167.B42]|nr:hypothetical protein [Calothrix sp. MO_167.B42]
MSKARGFLGAEVLVKNFTISLYAFHLRHTFTDAADEVDPDANLLWENLAKLGESSLPFPDLKDLRAKLICYQNGTYYPQGEQGRQTDWLTHSADAVDLGNISTTAGFQINASLQPFLLNDTYAVDFTLAPEPDTIPIAIPQLQYFQPASLLPSKIQASLGQTLWVYGKVDGNQNYKELAKQCAVALVAGTSFNPTLIREGELFGSLLFEYQARDANESNNPAKHCHILIVINHNQSPTITSAEKAYDWLLRLLCSYHKILYIYQLARQRYREAREIYSDLEKKIQQFDELISVDKTQLSELKSLMAKIPQKSLNYARCLQDLQTHQAAIITNITNYKTCLDNMKKIGGSSPQVWQDFVNKDCQKWQEQIQTDISYLAPGQELFGQFVGTIRGIIETQQAQSDRSLERTFQVLGTAFGGGAIVSGVVSQHIDKPFAPVNPNYPIHPLVLSLLWSILASFILGWIAWLITKPKSKGNQHK